MDRLYRPKGFASERERVEHPFMRYEKMRAPLESAVKTRGHLGVQRNALAKPRRHQRELVSER